MTVETTVLRVSFCEWNCCSEFLRLNGYFIFTLGINGNIINKFVYPPSWRLYDSSHHSTQQNYLLIYINYKQLLSQYPVHYFYYSVFKPTPKSLFFTQTVIALSLSSSNPRCSSSTSCCFTITYSFQFNFC